MQRMTIYEIANGLYNIDIRAGGLRYGCRNADKARMERMKRRFVAKYEKNNLKKEEK